MAKQVTMAVIGAGSRGYGYAKFAGEFPERLKIVAVADPDKYRRERMAKEHNIPADKCFESWEDFVKQPKMCDAVAICTQDNMHEDPAIACADLFTAICCVLITFFLLLHFEQARTQHFQRFCLVLKLRAFVSTLNNHTSWLVQDLNS